MANRQKSKQKKMNVRVDFTPMVDMNMLLITFFMLCTSLSKPQTMEINMPTKDDKNLNKEQQSKVKESLAVTLLLSKNNKVYYYEGLPKQESVKQTSYDASGIRDLLMKKNMKVIQEIRALKQKKTNLQINQKQYDQEASKIKDQKNTPTVIIKATDDATYKNLIDALDEMQICSISKYVIVPITQQDKGLITNYKGGGAH
jgi:biopolymer transport protein ExbD